ALLALGAAACGREEPAEAKESPAAVLGAQDVATAEVSTLSSGVALTGSLEPYRRVEVKAQVPGVVAALSADRGDAVRQGQTLARIEAEGIRSQAAGARSGVAAAEAGLALARRQLESARTLYEQGALSEIDFRGAQAQYEAAQAQLAAARAQATGAAEQAGRTAVVAPVAGEVSARSVEPGEAVSPGNTLFTVVNSRILELRGQVPVDQAAQVRQGQPVVFSLDAYPGREFRGTVSRVDPVADPATRQVGVTMQLPNEDRSLIGGLFATGHVVTGAQQQVVTVPTAAVRGTGAGAFVLVVEGGQVKRRPVRAGEPDVQRGVVPVLSGLRGGEQVIVSPGEVAEGTPVRMQSGGS
ncbi:MAG TPA: efflux RND transporter periplasmic adaptor subunit, partial [Longimicrobiaceae bacterium]|nr:efflux RND transporter periplasmic adaptor subunit [Longimicrobiaceae bacterium]